MDNDIRSRYRTPNHKHRSPQTSRRHITRPPLSNNTDPTPNVDKSEPPPVPLSFEPSARPRPKPKRFKKFKIFLILVVIGSLGAFGKLWIYPRYTQPHPFSPAIINSVKIPLFYPQTLPAGYSVDPLSFRTTSTEVVFNANNGSSRLVFTQQKIPAGFDFNLFYTKQLSDIRVFDTVYGHAVIGKNDGRRLGSLVTDKTWLLLSTNSQQPSAEDLSLILKNLKKY